MIPKLNSMALMLNKICQQSLLLVTLSLLNNSHIAQAQLIPVADTTLGSENSQVIPVDSNNHIIQGGATRGNNLFHSFKEFHVDNGRGVFFISPSGIDNIIGRVTGTNASNILGALGVLDNSFNINNANLFLINPHGVYFGANARLFLGGSFVASTADGLLFDNGFEFSASHPNIPPLMTVNIPVGLQFRETAENGIIQPINVEGFGFLANLFGFGLKVLPKQTLGLIGGDVNLLGGSLLAKGGRIELGGLSESGIVEINTNQGEFNFNFPDNILKANISFVGAAIDLRSDNGGSLFINANNFNTSNSAIQGGILSGLGTLNSQGGDITINASGTTTISDGSIIAIGLEPNASGNSGNINIKTNSFKMTGQSGISNTTSGQGNAGDIYIKAKEEFSLDNSGILSVADVSAIGNSGNVLIKADSISLDNLATVVSRTTGAGKAGNIYLNANQEISITNGKIFSDVDLTAIGDGGNININVDSGSLLLANDTQISAGTSGQGKAGNIAIYAPISIGIKNSIIASTVDFNALGNGGLIEIETSSLLLDDGTILASTFGQGNAGKIIINSKDSLILKNEADIFSNNFIGLQLDRTIKKPNFKNQLNGGDISITANTIVVNDSSISASTVGFGDAGNIDIEAINQVFLDNSSITSTTNQNSLETTGNGGDIFINVKAGSLFLSNSANLAASTLNRGNAGTIFVKTKDYISLTNQSFITTFAAPAFDNAPTGEGGNINIHADTLSLTDNARVISSTFGQKKAGDILVETNSTIIDTKSLITTQTGTNIVNGLGGNAGNLNIFTNNLLVQNGGRISGSTFNIGQGGNININAQESVNISRSGDIQAQTFADGNAGNVTLETRQLTLESGGKIAVTTQGQGNAGNINLKVSDNINLTGNNSGIFANTTTNSTGKGGNIFVDPITVSIKDGAAIAVDSQGSGIGGDIDLITQNLFLDNGKISATTASNTGGNINLQVANYSLLRNNSLISTTAGNEGGAGAGGNISVDTKFLIAVPFENSDITANSFGGQGGKINITAEGIFGLEIRNQLTSSSDITAFSQLDPTLNGQIILNIPETDPSNDLTELPESVVDPDQLIAQNPCKQGKESQFVSTGRGGLPPSPEQAVGNNFTQVDLVEPVTTGKQKPDNWQLSGKENHSQPITPVRGWILNEKGQLIFTAYDPKSNFEQRQNQKLSTCNHKN